MVWQCDSVVSSWGICKFSEGIGTVRGDQRIRQLDDAESIFAGKWWNQERYTDTGVAQAQRLVPTLFDDGQMLP